MLVSAASTAEITTVASAFDRAVVSDLVVSVTTAVVLAAGRTVVKAVVLALPA